MSNIQNESTYSLLESSKANGQRLPGLTDPLDVLDGLLGSASQNGSKAKRISSGVPDNGSEDIDFEGLSLLDFARSAEPADDATSQQLQSLEECQFHLHTHKVHR